jgi:DNA primase small subunit
MVQWGITRKIAKALVSRRDELASMWMGKQGKIPPDGVGPVTWRTIIQKAVERESARVDTVVTTDIHRLIRLPETLNAKTGFKAVEINSIDSFDPFRDAVVFEGEEEVYVRDAPQFRIVDQNLGPYEDEVVTVPSTAAVLLVAKGKALPRRD